MSNLLAGCDVSCVKIKHSFALVLQCLCAAGGVCPSTVKQKTEVDDVGIKEFRLEKTSRNQVQ